MRTININFTLTEREHELLQMGKCDKPNPQRIKMFLLNEAAKNLRYLSEEVLQAARAPKPAKPITWKNLPTKAEMAAKRAKTKPTHSDRSAQPKFENGGNDIEWMDDANIDKLRS